MFTIPNVAELKGFSVAGLTDIRTMAVNELTTLVASAADTGEQTPDDQLTRMEELQAFVAAADIELDGRADKAARLVAASVIPTTAVAETVVAAAEDDTVVAATGTDVSESVVVGDGVAVVEATVTAAVAVTESTRRTMSVADVAPGSPTPDVRTGDDAYTIIASSEIAGVPTGSELTWATLGKAFQERTRSHGGMLKGNVRGRQQSPLAMIRREFPENQIIMDGDGHDSAFAKLKTTSDMSGRGTLVAANGWCAPSEPDYSICNPITTDGLLNLPEMVLRRGGLLHNRGLDFGDFFGDDFVLPIPGYNILTEAQVIADTAKTCVEIPCPAFVDDRLNVAALCLTSSLLQNRGYPEFVSEFVQGAIAAMAHLVNRETINGIVTGSVAIPLGTVDPWQTASGDGTVWSQVMSAIDFAAEDLRYVYRAGRNQVVEIILPAWLPVAMRADWLRRNASPTADLTMGMINAALSERNVRVQWVVDYQDAFNPLAGVDTDTLLGAATPPIATPINLQFVAFLPGTWVLGRQDVIRLDSVYDSTNLQQNLVTQLFMEDGFLPMRMCQHSRAYTLPICPSGATGVQRAVACADLTP